MVQEVRYVQIDTKSFMKLCETNNSLKHEVMLLNDHIEELQRSNSKLSKINRQLKSKVNASRYHRESRFRHNLYNDITSFDLIVEENIRLKEENAKLKQTLSNSE